MNWKIVLATSIVLTAWSLGSAPPIVFGAEKLKLGTAVKVFPGYYLPALAAEEKGFWKEQGLEVEWAPFRTPTDLMQAAAGRTISIGLAGAVVVIPAAAAGVPMVIVGNLYPPSDFYMWVRGDSPYKDPKELKGAKIGVQRFGTAPHVYARVVTKAAGVEKEVRFVGTGDIPETVAALRVKAVDAIVLTIYQLIKLKLTGEARELARLADYLPKEWMDQVIFARKDFINSSPDVVRRVVKAVIRANNFALDNPAWTVEKLKALSGYPDDVAQMMVKLVSLSRTGKIEQKAVENVRGFLIEYELLPKDKAPPVEEIYTARFVE